MRIVIGTNRARTDLPNQKRRRIGRDAKQDGREKIMDDHWPYSPFNRNLLETPNQHTSTIRLPLNLICHCKMSNQRENRLRSIRWTQQNRWQ